MRLVIRKTVSGVYRAYFDKTPDFYGEGKTKQEAIQALSEKLHAVLNAIGEIQKGM